MKIENRTGNEASPQKWHLFTSQEATTCEWRDFSKIQRHKLTLRGYFYSGLSPGHNFLLPFHLFYEFKTFRLKTNAFKSSTKEPKFLSISGHQCLQISLEIRFLIL